MLRHFRAVLFRTVVSKYLNNQIFGTRVFTRASSLPFGKNRFPIRTDLHGREGDSRRCSCGTCYSQSGTRLKKGGQIRCGFRLSIFGLRSSGDSGKSGFLCCKSSFRQMLSDDFPLTLRFFFGTLLGKFFR